MYSSLLLLLAPLAHHVAADGIELDVTGGGANILPSLPHSCAAAGIKLVTSLPTPPPDLLTAAGLNSDHCPLTVPASQSSQLASYSSRFRSWFDASSSEINSALSECPELRSLASSLPICASSFLGAGGGSGGSATSTSSGSGTESSTGTGMESTGTGTGTGTGTETGTNTGTNTGTGTETRSTGSSTGSSTPIASAGASYQAGAALAALAVAGLVAAIN